MKKVPELRLKGFEGEWKNTKFKDNIISIQTGTNLLGSTDYGGIPLLKMGNIQRGFFSFDKLEYLKSYPGDENIVSYGDFLFNTRNTLELVGKGATWMGESGKFAFNSNIARFIFKGINSIFFNYLYNTTDVIRQVHERAMGTTSVAAIYPQNLNSLQYCLPQKEEQIYISIFFQTLDNLLAEQQNKLENLQKVKKSMLCKMFPKEGQKVPEIRFKGFEGDWNFSNASEIFRTYDERNRPDLPVLSANQDLRGMAPRNDSGYNISHDKSNEVTYKRVVPGQFVIHLRSFQGGFAHSSVEGITSPAYTVFGFKDNKRHHDYYWKYVFMSKSFIKRLKIITYGIRDGRSIGFNEFANMQFIFPSYAEQLQIASFLRSIDNMISLESQRLDKLKQIKSACLQKMFV